MIVLLRWGWVSIAPVDGLFILSLVVIKADESFTGGIKLGCVDLYGVGSVEGLSVPHRVPKKMECH